MDYEDFGWQGLVMKAEDEARHTADEMRRWGDEMQSEASRLAAAVRKALGARTREALGYEACLSLAAIDDLVERWTRIRTQETEA